MKAYQLVAPLLAMPFIAAAEGQADAQEYKQPLTQSFCSCACTVNGKTEPVASKTDDTQEQPTKGKERYLYVNTLEFGDPDLVW